MSLRESQSIDRNAEFHPNQWQSFTREPLPDSRWRAIALLDNANEVERWLVSNGINDIQRCGENTSMGKRIYLWNAT